MATRTIYVDDTTPEIKGQAADETGVLNLSGATALAASFVGKTYTFSGSATAIQPAEADADGIHHWNWGYPFAAGTAINHSDRDTHNPDSYDIYLTVTWSTGNVTTYGPDTLVIKAKT